MKVSTLLKCLDCDKLAREEDVEYSRLYECGCGNMFTREDSPSGSSQCPQCNKFAARIDANAGTRQDVALCPDCAMSEMEEAEGYSCDECDELFEDEEEAARHAGSHSDEPAAGTEALAAVGAVLSIKNKDDRTAIETHGEDDAKEWMAYQAEAGSPDLSHQAAAFAASEGFDQRLARGGPDGAGYTDNRAMARILYEHSFTSFVHAFAGLNITFSRRALPS